MCISHHSETIKVNECANKTMHHCDQGCSEMTFGYRCTCNEGYKLAKDRKTCTGQ